MVPTTGEMPKNVYAVGDTIRLNFSLLASANVEEVHAFYVREETSGYDASGQVREVSRSTISFEGSIEETTIEQTRPYDLSTKRHAVSLACVVDRDHVPGSYHLERLILRTAEGDTFDFDTRPGGYSVDADTFRIARGSVDSGNISLKVEEPEDDGLYA